MRLPNFNTAPMRQLIIKTFLQRDDFYGKNQKFLQRITLTEVLCLAKFSEIWSRSTTQNKVFDH